VGNHLTCRFITVLCCPFYTHLTLYCVCVVLGFAVPHDKAQFSHSAGAHIQHNLSGYSQQSHHAFQQYQLGGIPEGHSIKSDSGFVTGRSLWDMENMVPQVGGYSGSSGHQQGSSHAGVTLYCWAC